MELYECRIGQLVCYNSSYRNTRNLGFDERNLRIGHITGLSHNALGETIVLVKWDEYLDFSTTGGYGSTEESAHPKILVLLDEKHHNDIMQTRMKFRG